MLIKTGDKVRVIAGKDKGKEGTVSKVLNAKNQRYAHRSFEQRTNPAWRSSRRWSQSAFR